MVIRLDKINRQLKKHQVAIIVLIAYLVTATLYSLIIPIWESYDEDGHYLYARYIAEHAQLPLANDPASAAITEKIQPPLYYILAAAYMRLVNVHEYTQPILNPYFTWGNAGVNYAIHSEAEKPPYDGTALAVHIVRLLSVLMGAVAVWFTYLTGLCITHGHRQLAITAMALHAFWPQFLFHSSVISNDILACTIGSCITWSMVKLTTEGPSLLRVLVLGGLLGAALLTKLNNLILIPFALLVLIVAILGKQSGPIWKRLVALPFILAAVTFFVLTTWRFVATLPEVHLPWPLEFGLTGTRIKEILDRVQEHITWLNLRQSLTYLFRTFYASFGWGNVEVAPFLYSLAWGFQILAAAGGLAALFRHSPFARLPLLICLLNYLAFGLEAIILATYFGHPFPAHGRYLLPAITADMIFLAAGVSTISQVATQIMPNRPDLHKYQLQHPAGAACVIALFCVAILIPFLYIQPAYAAPKKTLVAPPHPIEVQFNHQAELIGYDIEPAVLQPGKYVDITLYWRCLAKIEQNYTVAIEVLDADRVSAGKIISYPGHGNWATMLWNPGDTFQDSYRLQLSDSFPHQSFAQLKIYLYDKNSADLLPISDMQGRDLGKVLVTGQFRVNTSQKVVYQDSVSSGVTFGDSFKLIAFSVPAMFHAGETESVVLYWESCKPVSQDYTVFVHLVDSQGRIIAQNDSPPREGRFPTTLWAPGDIVEDTHHLNIPSFAAPGKYTLRVGFYNLATMARLPVYEQSGQLMPEGEHTLKDINVSTLRSQ